MDLNELSGGHQALERTRQIFRFLKAFAEQRYSRVTLPSFRGRRCYAISPKLPDYRCWSSRSVGGAAA